MCFRPTTPVIKKVKCPSCGQMVIQDNKCIKCGADMPYERPKPKD